MIDFLIIGAGKSGTTSLYYYLAQHPDVFLSRNKEPRFFLLPGLGIDTTPAQREWYEQGFPEGVKSVEEYEALFADARPGQKRGEASIQYLLTGIAARNLARYAPTARLICLLRNPIERAFSNYQHAIRDKLEARRSILDILREEGASHLYFDGSFYGRQLECYAQQAPENPLRVWLYEEFVADPVRVTQEMFAFIGVDAGFLPDVSFRANVSGTAEPGNWWAKLYEWARKSRWRQSPLVRRFLSVERKRAILRVLSRKADAGRVRQEMSEVEWNALAVVYEEDMRKLEQVLGRDLGHWRQFRV